MDNQLFINIQNSDKKALQSLFERYYTTIHITIDRIVKDSSMSEDLAQQVFIQFWEKRKQINITTSVAAYLHRMAINEALSYKRKIKNKTTEELQSYHNNDLTATTEEDFLYSELHQTVEAAISTLPPRCQTIFRLSRFEGKTYKQIALELDISEKTVENQMGKALKILREKLKYYLTLSVIINWLNDMTL